MSDSTKKKFKIFSFDIETDEYIEVKPPFKPEEHLVYISATGEAHARQKIILERHKFMVSKGLRE